MSSKKEIKTNAMRILEKMKIPYEMQSYECEHFEDGLSTAKMLGLNEDQVYKTITTVGKSKEYFVFVLPVRAEIDFKKAAKAVGQKSLELLPLADLTAVTGYVRGGCTCIGMKKNYPVIIDESAKAFDSIHVSAGKIGAQLRLSPQDLAKASGAQFAEIIKKD